MEVVTFGSSSDNVVIINDDFVSPQHCQITQGDDGTFYLLDRGSVNGTFVNDTRIIGEVMLNIADAVRIGNTTLSWQSYFTYSPQPVIPPPPPSKIEYASVAPLMPPEDKPNNMLAWAILCTIFCCWPFGIPAIVNAAQVDGRWNRGDYEGSRQAARKARTWFWLSFAFGIVAGIISFIYYFIVGFAVGMSDLY